MSIQIQLVEQLGRALISRGFHRKGTNWFRATSEVYSIINVQKSRYDESCFINFGFSLGGSFTNEWLPENKCQVRFRLEALKSIDASAANLLDATNGPKVDLVWNESVETKIIVPLVMLVQKAQTLTGLREILASWVSPRVFIHKDAREVLARPEK